MSENEGKKEDKSKQEENTLSQEDIDSMNKDIKEAKDSLVSKETDSKLEEAKKQAKEEAKKEMEVQKKLEEQEKTNKELQEKLEAKEKEAADKLSKLQSKVDDIIGTKQAVQPADPFQSKESGKVDVKRMSDEEINALEENSARAFFGEDFDGR